MLGAHRMKANAIRQPSPSWAQSPHEKILESGEKTGVPRETTRQLLTLFAPFGEREAGDKVDALLKARHAKMSQGKA